MGLFNRRKSANDDINEYYASERRQRVGVAWLLGIATLFITVLLALGLFFGGRWVYRTIFSDEPATVQQGENDNKNQDNSSDDDSGSFLNDLTIDGTLPGDSNDNPVESESSNTNSNGASQSASNENIPSSGPTTELPSTGPSGPEELR